MAPQTANLKIPLSLLEEAHGRGEFTACALAVRHGKESHSWRHGSPLRGEPRALQPTDVFDLASLTKIFATTALLLQAESENRLNFEWPLTRWIPEFPDPAVTLRMLMEHRSGLPAHVEFYKRFSSGDAALGDQRALCSWICEATIDSARPQVYSDLGFMLLGFVLEEVLEDPLPKLFSKRIGARLGLRHTGFRVLPHAPTAHDLSLQGIPENFVATEDCPWRKKVMRGEVHDDNCWSMGGYAGHAGLFSTAEESLQLLTHCTHLLQANPELFPLRSPVPGSFHGGFMVYPGLRPFPDGGFPGAIGHTGFTGTSAWWHPEKSLRVVLLSNRVHPSRTDGRFIETRLKFHQALWHAFS